MFFVTATANKTRHSGAQGKLFQLRFQALYPPQLNVELKFNHKYSHYLRNEPFCLIFHKSLGQQATFKYTSLFFFSFLLSVNGQSVNAHKIFLIQSAFSYLFLFHLKTCKRIVLSTRYMGLSALYGGYSPYC